MLQHEKPDLIKSVIFDSLIFLSAEGFSFLFLIGITLICHNVHTFLHTSGFRFVLVF